MSVKKEILALAENILPRIAELSTTWDAKKARALSNDMHSIELKTGQRFRDIKKTLIICTRTLSGVIEGRKDQLLSKSQARTQMKVLGKTAVKLFLEEVSVANLVIEEEHVVSATAKDINSQVHASILEGADEVGQTLKANMSLNASKDHYQRVQDEKIIKVLEEYDVKVNKLPNRITTRYKLTKAPIIPITDNWAVTKPEKLKQAGIKSLHIDQWVILDDQFVLGINPDMLLADAKLEKKPANNYTEVFIKNILKRMNEELRPNERLQLFSKNPQKHKGVVYYWLMQTGRMDAWRQATGMSELTTKAWGFASKNSKALTDLDIFDKHLKEHQEQVSAIQKYKRQGLSKNDSLQRFKVFLHTKHGLDLNEDLRIVFDTIWKDKLPEKVFKATSCIESRVEDGSKPVIAKETGKPKLKSKLVSKRRVIKVRK